MRRPRLDQVVGWRLQALIVAGPIHRGLFFMEQESCWQLDGLLRRVKFSLILNHTL